MVVGFVIRAIVLIAFSTAFTYAILPADKKSL